MGATISSVSRRGVGYSTSKVSISAFHPHWRKRSRTNSAFCRLCGAPTWLGSADIRRIHSRRSAGSSAASKRCSRARCSSAAGAGYPVIVGTVVGAAAARATEDAIAAKSSKDNGMVTRFTAVPRFERPPVSFIARCAREPVPRRAMTVDSAWTAVRETLPLHGSRRAAGSFAMPHRIRWAGKGPLRSLATLPAIFLCLAAVATASAWGQSDPPDIAAALHSPQAAERETALDRLTEAQGALA